MKYQFKYKNTPCGVAAARAGKDDPTCLVIAHEFTSTEDGALFSSRLERIVDPILSKLPIDPSSISRLVAVIQQDGNTTVYINDFSIVASMRSQKNSIQAGENIYLDDIADITKIEFSDIDLPDDAGIVILLPCRWRQGLYFDFRPLNPINIKRDYPTNEFLGSLQSYLMFQDLVILPFLMAIRIKNRKKPTERRTQGENSLKITALLPALTSNSLKRNHLRVTTPPLP